MWCAGRGTHTKPCVAVAGGGALIELGQCLAQEPPPSRSSCRLGPLTNAQTEMLILNNVDLGYGLRGFIDKSVETLLQLPFLVVAQLLSFLSGLLPAWAQENCLLQTLATPFVWLTRGCNFMIQLLDEVDKVGSGALAMTCLRAVLLHLIAAMTTCHLCTIGAIYGSD